MFRGRNVDDVTEFFTSFYPLHGSKFNTQILENKLAWASFVF